MSFATHHLHKRKRIHKGHEKYPHPKKWKRFLDYNRCMNINYKKERLRKNLKKWVISVERTSTETDVQLFVKEENSMLCWRT